MKKPDTQRASEALEEAAVQIGEAIANLGDTPLAIELTGLLEELQSYRDDLA